MKTARADVIKAFQKAQQVSSVPYKITTIKFYLYEDSTPLKDLQDYGEVYDFEYDDPDELLTRLLGILQRADDRERAREEYLEERRKLLEMDFPTFLDSHPQWLK